MRTLLAREYPMRGTLADWTHLDAPKPDERPMRVDWPELKAAAEKALAEHPGRQPRKVKQRLRLLRSVASDPRKAGLSRLGDQALRREMPALLSWLDPDAALGLCKPVVDSDCLTVL